VVPFSLSINPVKSAIFTKLCTDHLKNFEKFKAIMESLKAIAFHDSKKSKGKGLEKLSEIRDGMRLMSSCQSIKMVVPLQSQVGYKAALSYAGKTQAEIAASTVYIAQWKEAVREFPSRARPKKLTLVDSLGNSHSFLCKAEKRVDARKDARIMEFVTILNTEVFKEDLSLKTYSVIPIAEESALIEWMEDLSTVKSIIDEGLKSKGGSVSYCNKEVQENLLKPDGVNYFLKKLVPGHPPVLNLWFQRQFPDPQKFVQAKSRFVASLARWSMVGYIIGLGDRHCENILMNVKTGQIVHVDFDCIFSQGFSLATPECVPFRLTQNFRAVLGITDYEGEFRAICEKTMHELRKHRRMLVSVLQPITLDPLMDRTGGISNKSLGYEILKTVDKKLQGMLDVGQQQGPMAPEHLLTYSEKASLGKDRGKGLSVEAQVDELIKAAICPTNLAKMYCGWAAVL
jgi:phosphatidylinositol kinase/protein kinase (PI-3  family)